jgi:hypothetical protein
LVDVPLARNTGRVRRLVIVVGCRHEGGSLAMAFGTSLGTSCVGGWNNTTVIARLDDTDNAGQ